MPHLKAFFTARPWHNLVPDQKHELVTAGLGEFNGMDYLTAAATTDRKTLMAYLPSARAITIDLSKLSATRLRGWWFNPRTGEAQPTGEFQPGIQQMMPPADGDWGLVIDDKELNLPAPGK